MFDSDTALFGGGDFFLGRAGLEPRPLSREEWALSSLLLLLEYEVTEYGVTLVVVSILITDGDWICRGWTRCRGLALGVGVTTDTKRDTSFRFVG